MSARRRAGGWGPPRAALGVLAVGALVASALLAPGSRRLGDYVSPRRVQGVRPAIEAARAATDAGALAREAEAARGAGGGGRRLSHGVERDEALARSMRRPATPGSPCTNPRRSHRGCGGLRRHRYLLVAHGEFGALLDYAAGVAEDAEGVRLSDLHVGPDPSAATDTQHVQITLTVRSPASAMAPDPTRRAARRAGIHRQGRSEPCTFTDPLDGAPRWPRRWPSSPSWPRARSLPSRRPGDHPRPRRCTGNRRSTNSSS